MRIRLLASLFLIAALPSIGAAQENLNPTNSYKVLATTKVGGAGGWGYIYADADARRLYVPRTGKGAAGRITVFDLDSLQPAGTIAGINAVAVTIDSKSNHGFAASKPVAMFDTQTLKTIKTIPVQGNADYIAFDAFKERVYVLSAAGKTATVLDGTDGSVLSTIDLGGKPSQAISDGQGKIYITISDTDEVAVIDANTMAVSARFDLDGVGAGPRGIALDSKNGVLFVSCANATMVYLSAKDGKFIYALPIGVGADAVAFNPTTLDIFSAQDQGTLTISKVSSPTNFAMSGDVETMQGAKNIAFDSKTGKLFLVTAKYTPVKTNGATPADLLKRGSVVANSLSIITVGQ